MSERENNSHGGCQPRGCAGCVCVIPIGLALAIFGAAIGGGGSVKIPFTEANISVAGSVGDKELTRKVLPDYVSSHVASSEDFINQSATLTVGPAEGTQLLVIGRQKGAPAVDINISTKVK